MWKDKGAQVVTLTYACTGAIEELSVAFFTAADFASFAAMQIGGTVHAMVQGPSG